MRDDNMIIANEVISSLFVLHLLSHNIYYGTFLNRKDKYMVAASLWGAIATILWIFSTKITSVWDLWWVPFT